MQQQTEKPVALKPCPFCGGKVEIIDGGDFDEGFSAHCEVCWLYMEGSATRDELAIAWNRRATGERVEKLVEAAEEAAIDLEAEIQARAPSELAHRINRDMQTVRDLRAALAAMKETK